MNIKTYPKTNEMKQYRGYYISKTIYIRNDVKGLDFIIVFFHEYIHYLISLLPDILNYDFFHFYWDCLWILILPRYSNKKKALTGIKKYYKETRYKLFNKKGITINK